MYLEFLVIFEESILGSLVRPSITSENHQPFTEEPDTRFIHAWALPEVASFIIGQTDTHSCSGRTVYG